MVLAKIRDNLLLHQQRTAVVLSSIFAILWSITALPHTVGIQYVCLVLGALISSCFFRQIPFGNKNSAPIILIFILCLWIIFHLFFLTQNFELQLLELNSIWKRALLGSIFALSLGFLLSNPSNIYSSWLIIIFGLAGPTFIFYLKYIACQVLPEIGLQVPPWLTLYRAPAEFYVPKISYVFFCIPCFGVAVGMIVSNLNLNKLNLKNFSAYFLLIVLIIGIFYLENIKNGIAYSAILLLIGVFFVMKDARTKFIHKGLVTLLCISVLSIFLVKNIESNQSWKTLDLDFRAALSTDPFDSSSYVLTGKYPLNENGQEVQPANYARIAWGLGAIRLIRDNPAGYGLVQSSFGHLVKQRYPSTGLAQSHSGWLDLALGIGLPGAFLVMTAGILAINNSRKLLYPLNILGPWFLGSEMLLWTTTEVSQKNYLNTFIWMIIFIASLSVGNQAQVKKSFESTANK